MICSVVLFEPDLLAISSCPAQVKILQMNATYKQCSNQLTMHDDQIFIQTIVTAVTATQKSQKVITVPIMAAGNATAVSGQPLLAAQPIQVLMNLISTRKLRRLTLTR